LVPRRVRFDELELKVVAALGCGGASVQVARGAGDTDTNEAGRRSGMIHSIYLVELSSSHTGFMRFAITGLL